MALLEPDQLAAVAIEASTIRLSVEEVTGNALRTFPDSLPELTVRLPRQERPRSSGKNLNECSLEMQNLIERQSNKENAGIRFLPNKGTTYESIVGSMPPDESSTNCRNPDF
jgi:hypothetical protein